MFRQENNTDGNLGARAEQWAQQYLKKPGVKHCHQQLSYSPG